MSDTFDRAQELPQAPEEAFEFFSDPFNLEAITPPWLHFKVLTPAPIPMGAGTLIDYRLRLRGVPVRWQTEIREWEPGVRFRDVQLRGPYSLWDHTHLFEPAPGGGTIVRDHVVYEIPLGPLGRLAQTLFVRRDLERVFEHREAEIGRLLGTAPAGA
jgi:ligand-binding SRPBCC domain-containing protein